MQTTAQSMKSLTRIRLINWHYFTDETINIKGSVLFSGENASGKSTILDAIQFVLTTNSRKFNPAANERSKRTLEGYVRCKTGEEGNTYLRGHGPVISFIALEFYEESRDRYFVIGVKMDSPEIGADINKKWFSVDGNLDSISFILDNRPVLDKEFTQDGKRIQLETQVSRAKENIKVRLGRLDDKYTEMIVKSMAFKPMEKVKDFINSFILPENIIQTENLQENIRNLREMQKLINDVKRQIEQLYRIVSKADEIDEDGYRMLVVDILMSIADLEAKKEKLNRTQKDLARDEATLSALRNRQIEQDKSYEDAQAKVNELNIAMASNECGRLIEKIERNIRDIRADIARAEIAYNDYTIQISRLEDAGRAASITSVSVFRKLRSNNMESGKALEHIVSVCDELKVARESAYQNKASLDSELQSTVNRTEDLEFRIEQLKKNRLVYDENTTRLLTAINDEFSARGIDSQARIFADLLEIEKPEWQDAVEGYLNTQRFNIIVDPRYYDIAADVYDRMKTKIHSAGIVNAERLMHSESEITDHSLSLAVSSENRFARAYADYILGRVICCDNVAELKMHNIAITRECMKYQGHVLQKIPESVYKTPYIGRRALLVQLEIAQKEYSQCLETQAALRDKLLECNRIITFIDECNFESAKKNVGAEASLIDLKRKLQNAETELADARNNPTFIELGIKLDAARRATENLKAEREMTVKSIANKERDCEAGRNSLETIKEQIVIAEEEKIKVSSGNTKALKDAETRYEENVRTKPAGTIAENYGPRRKTIENQMNKALGELMELQVKFKDGDLGTGMEQVPSYRDELEKLEKSDLIAYEDRLAKVQEDCEIEFRENFLAKMRENIERAETIFSQLNKSLKGIYYGNDSYKFELSPNKERQSLYDMITSDVNIAGQNLFTSIFEKEYHAEMEDLFSKLTDENLADQSIVNELTDYRSYLDYDIQIISKDGKIQKFSKTYGEKSGGETQTPYYVAIAASFAQIYSGRETARIVLLDEAFNNMDEDRIESMMQFFNSQNFQLIMAAPPARMEIIGEYIDSVYLVIRGGNCSTVEEYFL